MDQPGKHALPEITLHGVKLHAVDQDGAVRHILEESAAGRGGWVVTPNLDHMRRLARDPDFAALYAQATLCVADGAPLVWASRLQGTPLPERVPGSDLVSSVAAAAAAADRSLFLLGGNDGAADEAAQVLVARHPGLRVVGTACPPFGFEHDSGQIDALTEQLRSTQPDIVYVALGAPKQEQFIARFRALLPHTWWLGIGISLSFLSGEVRRAPRWVQRLGLEWLHRLIQEPRRLARRYIIHGLPFSVSLLAGAARQRFFPRSP